MKNNSENLFKKSWVIISILLLLSLAGKTFQNNGIRNIYVFQADALLKGHLDLEQDPTTFPAEVALVDGKYYNIFPPFPILFVLPFVALFGMEHIKISLIVFVLGSSSCYILFKILQIFEIKPALSFWVVAAFALGTAYWQTFRFAEWTWMFAQIISVCFMLLSIYEAQGQGRGMIAGLFLGLAFLSRQLSIYASVFIIIVLWLNPKVEKKSGNLLGFLLAFGFCILLYLGFIYIQFGELNSGYSKMMVAGIPPQEFGGKMYQKYGLFSFAHVPFNFIYMFVQGFHVGFNDSKQIIELDPYGTSLIAASPFLFAAFFAKMERAKLYAAWLSIILALIHMLLYFNNGYIQYNAQRFTLDFMPILIILVASGLENSSPDLLKVFKGAIIYSIALNLFTLILVG